MLQVDLLHHSTLGRRARVQSDDHHAQANLPAAKTTIHTMRNRNIETAKLACFLNFLRPSLIRVVRRKNIERTKRKIGIVAAMKAMILKIIVHSQCRVTRVAVGTCVSSHAPRTEPYVRLSRIRLPPRVYDGESGRIRSSAFVTRAWLSVQYVLC